MICTCMRIRAGAITHRVYLANRLDNTGDTMSMTSVYSDEAVNEVNKYLNSKKAYVGTDGKFIASTNVDTVSFVLFNMTG